MRTSRDRNTALPSTVQRQIGAGFTLIELISVLSIVAIITVLGLPSFMQFLEREKIEALATEFAQTIISARSAAVRTGIPVVLCASNNGITCAGDWNDGWLTFIDQDRDGDVDSIETLVNRYTGNPNVEDLAVADDDGAAVDAVRFNYRGIPDSALTVTVSANNQSTSLVVNPFGKPRYDD